MKLYIDKRKKLYSQVDDRTFRTYNPKHYRVLAGSIRRSFPYSFFATLREIDEFIYHRDFMAGYYTNDIALVKVKYLLL